MRKKLLLATITFPTILLIAATAFQPAIVATDNIFSSIPLIAMPEEYLNYSVTIVNGSLWAKIDGTYPLQIISDPGQMPDSLPLVYPTPPGTTNISMNIDGTEIDWTNYTEIYPEDVHHTALGDWPMINCTLYSVPEYFTLKIHYEHPILFMNGSYIFLYDLNISPYLSPNYDKSTAYFTINMEVNYTRLYANVIAADETLTPINYTAAMGTTGEIITFHIVSEYSKPLLGDILITFTTPSTLGAVEFPYLLTILSIAIIATMIVRIVYSRRRSGARLRMGPSRS